MPDHALTADLYDQFGESLQCCTTQFHQYGGRRHFHGQAVTLQGHEDNTMLSRMVDEPGNGKVIVIDGGGSFHCAMLGDKNAQRAADNGWAGFVVNGVVRDVARLAGIDIGVKALGCSPRKSNKAGNCRINVSVTFGGVIFVPGAHVVADDDGVIVLPRTAPVTVGTTAPE